MASITEKNKYTDEQIADFWEWYHKAEPYPEEFWNDYEFDSPLDSGRLAATTAKDILIELGLLNEVT